MQKKKQLAEIPLEKSKKEILKTFRSELIKTKNKFNDSRKVYFKNLGDGGKFSYEFEVENGKIKRMKDFMCIFRGQEEIEIYFNQWELEQVFFKSRTYRECTLY